MRRLEDIKKLFFPLFCMAVKYGLLQWEKNMNINCM